MRAIAVLMLTAVLTAALAGASRGGDLAAFDKAALSKTPRLPEGTPAEQVDALIKDYRAAVRALERQFGAATTEAEQQAVMESAPDDQEYAALLLKIARQHPRDPAAVRALIWIVRNAPAPAKQKDAPFAVAQTILKRDHLDDVQIGPFCLTLRHNPNDPQAAKLVRRVLESNPHKSAQSHAAFALSKMLRARAEWARHIQTADAIQLAEYEKGEGREVVAELKRIDVGAMIRQAEDLLERIVQDVEFAATPIEWGQRTRRLGEVAENELFALRHLQLGKLAPEITGEDLDGKPMQLSDYRGKVVLLDFWGHW